VQFAPAQVTVIEETRNATRVDVVTQGEGETLIVFSRPWYPGFRAHLDGQPVAVELADLMLPTVRLPAGASGRLVLEYRPRSLVVGAWSAAVTACLAVVIWVLPWARQWWRRPLAVSTSPSRRLARTHTHEVPLSGGSSS
jgi:uncharacterized membrane protein YfhO